jgi:hypothetical protein
MSCKLNGVDWAPSTTRETWLLLQTTGFKDFVKEPTKNIEDSRDEQMFFNTMAAIYPTSHPAYNFIKHHPNHLHGGKVRKAKNALAHGEDMSKGGNVEQETIVQDHIQSVTDFLTAMGVDESEWKKGLKDLSNNRSLSDEDKETQRKLRLTAALSKMLGCIRLKVKDAVDAFHDKCRAEFDTWAASNPSATGMERTEKAREIWKGNITEDNGQRKLFNFEVYFDTLSGLAAFNSKMQQFDKDHPDPAAELVQLQADLATETNNAVSKSLSILETEN